jgi:tRNA threonylcarbamoyladenosine biosynthesis protein TsaB
MPRILHIETSGKTCSAAISKGQTLSAYDKISEDKSHASSLSVMIQALLDDDKLTAQDLDAVAVSAGPGSYTGLRIGVSVAKGICYAAELPLIAVPTLKVMLNTILATHNKAADFDLFVPMMDARRMEVYQAVYTLDGKTMEQVSPLILDKFAYQDFLKNHKLLFFGDGAEKAKDVIIHPNASFFSDALPEAKYMISEALNRYHHNDFEDIAYYEPFYLKAFQATKPKNPLL